jgi:ribonucleoside-diphosphate reductase alpha chain
MTKSIVDYIFRWLALQFLSREECTEIGIHFDETKEDIKVAAQAQTGIEESMLKQSQAEVKPEVAPAPKDQTQLPFPGQAGQVSTEGTDAIFNRMTQPQQSTMQALNSAQTAKAAMIDKTTTEHAVNEPFSYSKVTVAFDMQSDAPACDTRGNTMVRNAACYKCLNCGATSGCS